MQSRNWLITLLKAGLGEDKLNTDYRSMLVVNLFSFVGLLLTFSLAIVALTNQNFILAATLFIASALFLSGYFVQQRTQSSKISSNIILYSLMVLMVYMVYTGGVHNTGPLWIFLVAPVTLFIHGLKRGLLGIAVFVVVISTMMFFPDNQLLGTEYTFHFKTRLLLSFLTITFLAAFYEYSREDSFQQALNISKEFEKLAKLDPLTKLSNRRDALEKLTYEYSRMERTKEPVSILLCDLDHFKSVNDNYGHPAGDQLLQEISQQFKSCIRAQDTVSRWGGEEFLFILPQTNAQQAVHLSEKLHECLRSFSIKYQEHDIGCTISIGACEISPTKSISEVLQLADNALYQAKADGRNQTVLVAANELSANSEDRQA